MLAGPRSAGRLTQGFYTEVDQLLTIDNLSLNGLEVACDEKSSHFRPEMVAAWARKPSG
jgi:hypothetical protein